MSSFCHHITKCIFHLDTITNNYRMFEHKFLIPYTPTFYSFGKEMKFILNYLHVHREDLTNRPKSELSKEELEQLEEFEFKNGPMALINDAMITRNPVIISLRNNHKLIARVKAFDRHCNMVLENVKELWTEKKGKQAVNRERFISKLFLRGDSVIVVLKAPLQ